MAGTLIESYTNNASTTLAASITTTPASNTQDSIQVVSVNPMPQSGQYRLIIDNELMLAQASTYVQQILLDNPINYWKMDEASGTNVTDLSRSYTLVASNSSMAGQPGPITTSSSETSYSFGGTSSYYLHNNFSQDYTALETAFSVELWFKTSNISSETTMIHLPNNWYLDILANGKIKMVDMSGSNITTTNAYNNGNWHHLVISIGTTLASSFIYVDGASVATTTVGTWSPNTNIGIYIGGFFSGTVTQNFNGNLSQIAFYNFQLSSTRVSVHYNSAIHITLTVLRGIEGTTTATHSNGTLVAHVLTSGSLIGLVTQRAFANNESGGNLLYNPTGAKRFDGWVPTALADWSSYSLNSVGFAGGITATPLSPYDSFFIAQNSTGTSQKALTSDPIPVAQNKPLTLSLWGLNNGAASCPLYINFYSDVSGTTFISQQFLLISNINQWNFYWLSVTTPPTASTARIIPYPLANSLQPMVCCFSRIKLEYGSLPTRYSDEADELEPYSLSTFSTDYSSSTGWSGCSGNTRYRFISNHLVYIYMDLIVPSVGGVVGSGDLKLNLPAGLTPNTSYSQHILCTYMPPTTSSKWMGTGLVGTGGDTSITPYITNAGALPTYALTAFSSSKFIPSVNVPIVVEGTIMIQ